MGNIGEHNIESIYEVHAGDNFGWTEREGPFVVKEGDPTCSVYALPANKTIATWRTLTYGKQGSYPETEKLDTGEPKANELRFEDKGGKEAKDEMIEMLRTGLPGALTVDGPRGPAHVVKPGIIEMAPNLPWKHDVPLAAMMRDRLGVPCTLGNDANAAAWALQKPNDANASSTASHSSLAATRSIRSTTSFCSMKCMSRIAAACSSAWKRMGEEML